MKEKVTFKEWYNWLYHQPTPKRELISMQAFQFLYTGYSNFCWYREVEQETAQEVWKHLERSEQQ